MIIRSGGGVTMYLNAKKIVIQIQDAQFGSFYNNDNYYYFY